MDYTPANKGLAVVFVGCGGTYWTSANYFCSLLKQMNPSIVHLVDPDKLEERDTARQWCQIKPHPNGLVLKASAAYDLFVPKDLLPSAHSWNWTFQEWVTSFDPTYQEDLVGKDILVIVNVDNDEARLAVRQWCLERLGRTLMVMSGCDMNYGQVYYGVYKDGGARHDWLPFHPEVGNPEAKPLQGDGGGCGAQSTMSNFMTGALFGPAILEAIRWWTPTPPPKVSEFYWNRKQEIQDDGTTCGILLPHVLKTWSQRVEPEVIEVEEVL